MAFRWWADDGPFIAVFVSPIPLSTKNKVEPPLTKLSGPAHEPDDVRSLVCVSVAHMWHVPWIFRWGYFYFQV